MTTDRSEQVEDEAVEAWLEDRALAEERDDVDDVLGDMDVFRMAQISADTQTDMDK